METSEDSKRGKFIIVFGPTGSGKSVLVNYVRENHPEITFPTSYTTRPKRPGQENTSYKFISVEEFNRLKDEGVFLEWAQFGDNYYATGKDEISEGLQQGKMLVKEMELQGILQTRELLAPEDVFIIYIDAGSWDDLAKRVRARAPISDEELAQRKQRYEEEVKFKEIANVIVENPEGKIEESKKEFERVIETLIKK
jgi:guanylate kinase